MARWWVALYDPDQPYVNGHAELLYYAIVDAENVKQALARAKMLNATPPSVTLANMFPTSETDRERFAPYINRMIRRVDLGGLQLTGPTVCPAQRIELG